MLVESNPILAKISNISSGLFESAPRKGEAKGGSLGEGVLRKFINFRKMGSWDL